MYKQYGVFVSCAAATQQPGEDALVLSLFFADEADAH